MLSAEQVVHGSTRRTDPSTHLIRTFFRSETLEERKGYPMKLTDQGIRGLPFTEKGQRFYTDDSVRGLAVCVGTRTKTFTLIVRKGDQRKRLAIGQYDPPHFTLAMAREKARDLLAEERLKKTETLRITFADAFDLYDRIHISELRKGTQRALRQTFARHFAPLSTHMLDSIRPTDIAPLLDQKLDTPTERHNAFVYLSMFFNWSMRRGYIDTTPTARMQAPKKPPSRERVCPPTNLSPSGERSLTTTTAASSSSASSPARG